MGEIVTIHVGQCGNQIGARFLDLAEKESDLKNLIFSNQSGLPRSVLVDMECGVLNRVCRLRKFDTDRQVVSDVSGSGNNWAVGHYCYGPQYVERIADCIRHQLEQCDRLDSLHLFASASGGTGSGLGSFILELLSDEKFSKICTVVFPSIGANDVVTSPYNAVLTTAALVKYASAVLVVTNDHHAPSWNDNVCKVLVDVMSASSQNISSVCDIVRKFLVPSLAPNGPIPRDLKLVPRCFDAAFSEFNPLCVVDRKMRRFPNKQATWVRSMYSEKDVQRNVPRLWNPQVHCSYGSRSWGQFSLSSLYNTDQVYPVFDFMLNGFERLLKRKANLHHYTEWMSLDEMNNAFDTVMAIRGQYSTTPYATQTVNKNANARRLFAPPLTVREAVHALRTQREKPSMLRV